MDAFLGLPTWALVPLLVLAFAAGFMVLHIAAAAAETRTGLHDFKIKVITLRNGHLQRLKALYSGDDPTGAAASLFGDDSDVEIVQDRKPAAEEPSSKAAA